MNTAEPSSITLAPGIRAFRGEGGYGYRSYSYALSTDAGTVLIDTTDPALIPLLRDVPTPRFLVLTHRHARQGEAEYEARFQLRVYLHPADADAPRAGPAAGTPAASRYHDPATDETLRELGFQFLPVPGHTPGSQFIFWDRHGGVLFTGDTAIGSPLGASPALSLPPTHTCDDAPRMRASVKALARPEARSILPAHGEFIMNAEPAELDRMWSALLL